VNRTWRRSPSSRPAAQLLGVGPDPGHEQLGRPDLGVRTSLERGQQRLDPLLVLEPAGEQDHHSGPGADQLAARQRVLGGSTAKSRTADAVGHDVELVGRQQEDVLDLLRM
jgi:hypothetical protein